MTDDTVPDTDDAVDETAIGRAADIVAHSDHLVGFTGAGVSTESGIPDFRSPGGIWDRYDPSDFTIQTFRSDPQGYWERRLEMRAEMEFDWDDVEPNPAHHAFADLERDGPLEALVTQNVDGLHQAAGNADERVLELHGTRTKTKCLQCDGRWPIDHLDAKLDAREIPPQCNDCGGLLKRATVSFGEALPGTVLNRAREEARRCDCFLVAGSSLTVEPAASLPRVASQSGASLVIVNLESTAVSSQADYEFRADVTDVLPALVDAVR